MNRSVEGYLVESLVVLCVVVLLAAGLLYVARRAGLGQPLGPVELLARLPLEARRSVYVVRIVDQVLILGASEAGLAKLGELPSDAAAQLAAAPRSGSFAEALRSALSRGAPGAATEQPATESKVDRGGPE